MESTDAHHVHLWCILARSGKPKACPVSLARRREHERRCNRSFKRELKARRPRWFLTVPQRATKAIKQEDDPKEESVLWSQMSGSNLSRRINNSDLRYKLAAGKAVK